MKSIQKELKYPVFLSASQCAIDVFWRCIFEEMAYNNCPFGVFIDANTLSVQCNFKGKSFNYCFHEKPVQEIHDKLVDLFKTKLQLYSKNDYLKSRSVLTEELKVKFESWKDIKKKSIKDILLENFILSLRDKLQCSYAQLRKLLSILHMAFSFKMITNNDVILDPVENKIIDIEGFSVEQMTLPTFMFQQTEQPKVEKSIDQSKTDLITLWNKYIKIDS